MKYFKEIDVDLDDMLDHNFLSNGKYGDIDQITNDCLNDDNSITTLFMDYSEALCSINQDRIKHSFKVKNWIRNSIPLIYRESIA